MKTITLNGQQIPFPEEQDEPDIATLLDGGTIEVNFTDNSGVMRHLYVDRRLRTTTHNHLYADAYPGKPDSRDLGLHLWAVDEIEAILKD